MTQSSYSQMCSCILGPGFWLPSKPCLPSLAFRSNFWLSSGFWLISDPQALFWHERHLLGHHWRQNTGLDGSRYNPASLYACISLGAAHFYSSFGNQTSPRHRTTARLHRQARHQKILVGQHPAGIFREENAFHK